MTESIIVQIYLQRWPCKERPPKRFIIAVEINAVWLLPARKALISHRWGEVSASSPPKPWMHRLCTHHCDYKSSVPIYFKLTATCSLARSLFRSYICCDNKTRKKSVTPFDVCLWDQKNFNNKALLFNENIMQCTFEYCKLNNCLVNR